MRLEEEEEEAREHADEAEESLVAGGHCHFIVLKMNAWCVDFCAPALSEGWLDTWLVGWLVVCPRHELNMIPRFNQRPT